MNTVVRNVSKATYRSLTFGYAYSCSFGELRVVEVNQKATAKTTFANDLFSFGQLGIQVIAPGGMGWPSAFEEVHQYVIDTDVAVKDATKIYKALMDWITILVHEGLDIQQEALTVYNIDQNAEEFLYTRKLTQRFADVREQKAAVNSNLGGAGTLRK